MPIHTVYHIGIIMTVAQTGDRQTDFSCAVTTFKAEKSSFSNFWMHFFEGAQQGGLFLFVWPEPLKIEGIEACKFELWAGGLLSSPL